MGGTAGFVGCVMIGPRLNRFKMHIYDNPLYYLIEDESDEDGGQSSDSDQEDIDAMNPAQIKELDKVLSNSGSN